jgi:hypothetical protein
LLTRFIKRQLIIFSVLTAVALHALGRERRAGIRRAQRSTACA